jgi:hypothetical protein
MKPIMPAKEICPKCSRDAELQAYIHKFNKKIVTAESKPISATCTYFCAECRATFSIERSAPPESK